MRTKKINLKKIIDSAINGIEALENNKEYLDDFIFSNGEILTVELFSDEIEEDEDYEEDDLFDAHDAITAPVHLRLTYYANNDKTFINRGSDIVGINTYRINDYGEIENNITLDPDELVDVIYNWYKHYDNEVKNNKADWMIINN